MAVDTNDAERDILMIAHLTGKSKYSHRRAPDTDDAA